MMDHWQNAEDRELNSLLLVEAAYEALTALQEITDPDAGTTPEHTKALVEEAESNLRYALRVDDHPEHRFGADIVTEEGARFVAWTNGYAVGYRCTSPTGEVQYLYFNPSGGTDGASPDAFVYVGPTGDPANDTPECFVCPFQHWPSRSHRAKERS